MTRTPNTPNTLVHSTVLRAATRRSWPQMLIPQAPHLKLLQISTYLWIATRSQQLLPPRRSTESKRRSTDTTQVAARTVASIRYVNSSRSSSVLVEKEMNSKHHIGTYSAGSRPCATH